MRQAMENTKVQNPRFLAQFDIGGLGISGYAVTAHNDRSGATAFMYPGVMEELHQRMGTDYYVVPVNVREVLVVGKNENITPDELRATLSETNRNAKPEERLSSKVCEYNGAEKKLSVCKTDKTRKQER